jgi:colanic acid/amylovoran biosynthesis protein
LEGYRAADLIIATGGTYLVEHYDLGQRLFDMSMAVASGKPFILFTQSAGPFLQRRNRRLLRRIFQATQLLLLRDAQTQHHLQELGLPTGSLRIKPDAAFALADSDLLMRPIDRSPLAKTSPHVILSVRAWNYFRTGASEAGMQRYKEAFATLTMHLIEHYNAHVTFLSTCQGVEGYHDDSRLAKAIEAELPEAIQKSVIVDRSFHTPGELRELMRSGDWIVATRMHFAILALGVGAPVLPIAYEFKTSELFRSLGCDEPLSIETLTPQSLITAFDHAVRQYGDIAERIRAAVDGFRLDACSVADTLKTALPELALRHSSQCVDAPSDLAFRPQSVGAVAQ